jgi:hypothetical protein
LSVLWTGAPDCPVCHRTVFDAPCSYEDEPATLGKNWVALRYNSPDYLVCHRNVRCTSGATANSRNGRLQKCADSATVENSVRQSQSAPDSEQDLSGVAPDCPVSQEDNGANGRLLPNPNGWVTWRRTG